jgi:hypothetical protein
MTFADKLKELRERATKGPVLIESNSRHLHQVSLRGRHNRITDDMLAWDADLYAFLANHAEQIEALVRAAEEYEKESTSPVKDYGLVAIRRKQVFAALVALDKSQQELAG